MTPYDDDDADDDSSLEPTPAGLAHWAEEHYSGDDRFESIEIEEPGLVEGEAVRVSFIVNSDSQFFVAVLEDDERVRVGFMTASKDLSKSIEATAAESADSLTEFLADAMGADDELEHEVQHFKDEAYYFCSDIPYQRPEELAADVMHDEVVHYLDGYLAALGDMASEGE